MAPSTVSEGFDIISHQSSREVYPDWQKLVSAKLIDWDAQVNAFLREHYPDYSITAVPTTNIPLAEFAALGHASTKLDTETDSVLRWRGYVAPTHRGQEGQLGDAIFFAKYHYVWLQQEFILYLVGSGYSQMQYVLKEPGEDETVLSNNKVTDQMLLAAVKAVGGDLNQFVYVFDNYWTKSKDLWNQIQKSSWDKVILDPKMKQSLQDISTTFFDSKEVYERYGVPWRRGLIFAGPPGNGKTISIKALMKTLYGRKDPIPTLYVKHAPQTFHLAQVFQQARTMSPCLLVMEDIETIVTPLTRSYFFNEVDGLGSNDGILIVASTNYLDKLDPGLSKRPSRFDRKFIFPLPNEGERTLYAQFWRNKLQKSHSDIQFPEKLCPAMAKITGKFSFAYLQEAFIATLLVIARENMEEEESLMTTSEPDFLTALMQRRLDEGKPDDELDAYKLWRIFKTQVAMLRENMGSDGEAQMKLPAVSEHALPNAQSPSGQAHPSQLGGSWRHGLPTRLADQEFQQGRGDRHEPTSLEMARAGIVKQQYIGEQAYEWKH